jgi:hypothetical protein
MRFWPFGRRVARDVAQLGLPLDTPPRTAEELLDRLRALGLSGIDTCRLTGNRAVLVSFRGSSLRVHEGYLTATEPVLRAVVDFVRARTRTARRDAGNRLAEHPVLHAPRVPAAHRTHADDAGMAARLAEWHAQYNAELFGGELRAVAIHVSRRMRTRLGHYAASLEDADPEIVISRRHIRRHGWEEARHTLLHEMVHQWQDEGGLRIDHGRTFRRKCRELGISPRATRDLAARGV